MSSHRRKKYEDDTGYVTVEGALVISALVITTMSLVMGLLLMSAHATAVTTARHATRVASLGASPEAVGSLVAQVHPDAQVQVREEWSEDLRSDLLHVHLSYPAPAFFSDIEINLVAVKEPEEER